MKRSNRLILLIGVFLAALAFVFVVILLGPGGGGGGGVGGASAPPAKIATVVAAKDIALGVTVTADMLTTIELAPDLRLPGAYGDKSQVNGIARATVTKGSQITSLLFVEAAGANLEVPAGYTGLAILVDQVSGVGTLIKTGDYVDIVASISPTFPLNTFLEGATAVSPIDAPAYDPTSVKVLIQGVQVISTLLPPPPTTETGAASPAPDSAPGGTSLNGQQEIVILAVTPQQAEVLKFAQLDGNISVMLRSPKDFVDENGDPVIPETVTTTGIILKTLIDDWGVLPPVVIVIPEPTAVP